MFYYLNGEITLMEGNLAVVDCGGVGYACRTTSYTLSKLRVGQTAKLFTYCNIREDAFDIYGFSTRDELRCFELLLGVTGVGPKAAIAILSSTSPERFMLAIMTQDEKSLTVAQGVGKKLAQRIILELKDKMARETAEGQARCRLGGRFLRQHARFCRSLQRKQSGAGSGCPGGAGLQPERDRRGADTALAGCSKRWKRLRPSTQVRCMW